jgi:inosine-uridine nucleoside N-ribohydrolase
LSPGQLARLNRADHSSLKLQQALYDSLSKNTDVEILLLSPPVDLVAVLKEHSELRSHIKQIYVMGGWGESIPAGGGEPVLRTTYNWNMDPIGSHASAELVKMKDVPMTVFSYHAIKKAFPSRSVNPGNYPGIFDAFEKSLSRMMSWRETAKVSHSWDGHILDSLPKELPASHPLKQALTQYRGRQFAPADALAVLGMFRPDMILESRPVSIHIDESDTDPKTGIRVRVTDDPASRIRVVERLDPEVFAEAMTSSFLRGPDLTDARTTPWARASRMRSVLCRWFSDLAL